MLLPAAAFADVIEIGDDGAAVTYSRPTVFTDKGPTAIGETRQVVAAPAPRAEINALLTEAATRNAIDLDLLREVAWQESQFRPQALSKRNAFGVMQLTAATARDLGVDRFELRDNIHGGARYLRAMMDRYGGDVSLALAAYNAGPSAVDRYRGVPPYRETLGYVGAILQRLSLRAGAVAPFRANQP